MRLVLEADGFSQFKIVEQILPEAESLNLLINLQNNISQRKKRKTN